MDRLNKDFFERNSVTVAQDLLGKLIVANLPEGKITAKIVETEAYSGEDDLACHASKGRTKRTETLFGQAGKLYVYFNYGIFYLTNIVCDKKDFPSAVLIRSAEVIEGKEIAEKNISQHKFVKANHLLSTGPGKFSVALGINRDFNGVDITESAKYYLIDNDEKLEIIAAKRVGVDYAKHCKDFLWRFYVKDNLFVSKQ